MPEAIATLLADCDAAKGAIFDDGHVLSSLIGRPTTSLAQSIADAFKA